MGRESVLIGFLVLFLGGAVGFTLGTAIEQAQIDALTDKGISIYTEENIQGNAGFVIVRT